MTYGQLAKNVATPGTAEPLSATSVPCRWLMIRANKANTGSIYLGNAEVSSADGVELFGTEPTFFPPIDEHNRYDLSRIYIDADVAGEGVRVLYGKL